MTRRRELLKRIADEPTEEWDVEWVGTSGLMPEESGYTKVNNYPHFTTITVLDDSIDINFSGLDGYIYYIPTDYQTTSGNAEWEADFEITQMPTSNGTRMQIAPNKAQCFFNNSKARINGSSSYETTVNANERHKFKLSHIDGVQTLCIDGVPVVTTSNMQSQYNTQTRFFAMQNKGEIRLYSLKYREVD